MLHKHRFEFGHGDKSTMQLVTTHKQPAVQHWKAHVAAGSPSAQPWQHPSQPHKLEHKHKHRLRLEFRANTNNLNLLCHASHVSKLQWQNPAHNTQTKTLI